MSDPVAVEFSLNTQMFLLSKRTLWLSDGSIGFGQESDVAFSEGLSHFLHTQQILDVLVTRVKPTSFPAFLHNLGDTIYGRVMVDPVQNLGDSFFCSIEKVFLCTGTDGYVPKYNPTKFEFGCLADSPSLLYRFKILVSSFLLFSFIRACAEVQSTDRQIIFFLPSTLSASAIRHQDKAQPETQARAFGDVSFNALLAVDDSSAMSLVRQPGSDGFRLDSTAMFQVFYTLLCLH